MWPISLNLSQATVCLPILSFLLNLLSSAPILRSTTDGRKVVV
jgi:hypothetical protein